MIFIVCAVFGAIYGGWRAKARKGRTADILQYAVTHAILFGLIGLFITLFLERIVF